ncbi:MAG: hypothetical protein HFE81_02625 [Bacilli bacterium]|nr:hypothetical protein [Bacilli bacterium]
MLSLTSNDKVTIDKNYESFLKNLYIFLSNCSLRSGIEYSKIIIDLLHSGKFGMNGEITCTNDYDFLYLPNLESDGMLVMYGVCCCRHATRLLNDILRELNFETTLNYFNTNDGDSWKKVSPCEANHIVVNLKENGNEYLIDPVNSFILKIDNSDISLVDVDNFIDLESYSDSNILEIGKVLTKYYNLKRLGINHIYE